MWVVGVTIGGRGQAQEVQEASVLGGLADWRSRTLELWQWRQGDFQATNGCIFSMSVSTLLVDAVERGLLPVGAVVSACGTGTGVAGFARIRRLSLQLRLQRLLVPVVGGNSLSAQHLLEELH